jgi:hypothetical protein
MLSGFFFFLYNERAFHVYTRVQARCNTFCMCIRVVLCVYVPRTKQMYMSTHALWDVRVYVFAKKEASAGRRMLSKSQKRPNVYIKKRPNIYPKEAYTLQACARLLYHAYARHQVNVPPHACRPHCFVFVHFLSFVCLGV